MYLNSIFLYKTIFSGTKPFKYLTLCLLLSFLCFKVTFAQIKTTDKMYAERTVSFSYPNGPYTDVMLSSDFGNGTYPAGRGFADIKDSTYRITFKKGQKVSNTGAAVQLNLPEGTQYTLQYRIKYDAAFQSGLHGKQLGFDIGVGYDGGRGALARKNGDGGSVRLQFDAHGPKIANQLYVYYCGMSGDYGNNPGGQSFSMDRGVWNTIRFTVTMQSSAVSNDGRIEVWCNGEKKINVGNIRFIRKESSRKITRLALESFPGGGGAIPLYDNYVYFDDIKWSKLK
jgi:hypothetical protein